MTESASHLLTGVKCRATNVAKNFGYLKLGGFGVGEIERLKDVHNERHQVLHNILVVPGQENFQYLILHNQSSRVSPGILVVHRGMKGLCC